MPTAAGKPLDASTRLALERTRLAHERALMLRVVTAASLIMLGFALGRLQVSARPVAVAMMGAGLLIVFAGTLTYRRRIGELRADTGALRRSTAIRVAALIFGLGTLALVATLMLA